MNYLKTLLFFAGVFCIYKLFALWTIGDAIQYSFLTDQCSIVSSSGLLSEEPCEEWTESNENNTIGPIYAKYIKCGLYKYDLSFEAFERGYNGMLKVVDGKKVKKNDILTIIDFTKPSNKKRMYVIDLDENELMHHTLVSHGVNSGGLYAKKFSNTPNSYQSSLGFYATKSSYYGEHGYSLRITGLEKGINHKALERAIVIHGADYVSDQYCRQAGRLGRSWGCPALPTEVASEIINEIKMGSCIFIYAEDDQYVMQSPVLNS